MIFVRKGSVSTVSILVAVLLFAVVSRQHDNVNNRRQSNNVSVVIVDAFVTTTSHSKIKLLLSNHYHHHTRRSLILVRKQLSNKSISDETTAATTPKEVEENESNTSIPVKDDSTTDSNTASANPSITATNTASSAVFHIDCDEGDTSEECVFGSEEILGECLPEKLVTLPTHTTSIHVNQLLRNTEQILRNMHINSTVIEMSQILAAKEAGRTHECIYANNYVDLGKIDTYVIVLFLKFEPYFILLVVHPTHILECLCFAPRYYCYYKK
jgi:hypothetical protein